MLIVLRLALGAVFVVSGFDKLMQPAGSFLAIVEKYQLVNHELAQVVAWTLPWIELFFGVFVIVGLWLKVSIGVLMSIIIVFITAVGQTIFRELPIKKCGCFSESMSLPLPVVMVVDSIIFALLVVLFKNIKKARRFGLDNYFSGK